MEASLIKDFELLEKKCKKHLFMYRVKRWGWVGILLLLIIGGWYGILRKEPSNNPHSSSLHPTPTKKTSVQPQPSCFGLQFMYAYATKEDRVIQYKQKLEKLGHKGCFIQKGEEIPQKNTYKIFLICDTRPTKKELAPFISLAKRQKLSYLIVPSPCEKRVPPISQLQKQKYDQALAKARFYYLQKDYANTQKWAMRANEIDKTRPEAWILYAKALWYQGKRGKAIQLLRFFLRYQKSREAQKVLSRMLQDKAP